MKNAPSSLPRDGLADAAAVAARLLEALADGDVAFAVELATELDIMLAGLLERLERSS